METVSANRNSVFLEPLWPRERSAPTPKIISTENLHRPEGYALPDFHYLALTLEVDDVQGRGYGAGDAQVAYEKALSEALERVALFSYCRKFGIDETSNGWACHANEKLAIDAAILELIERDVAMSSWLNCEKFYELPQELWPKALLDWQKLYSDKVEFHTLKILLSENENGAAVSALLFNSNGNFLSGHASGLNLEDAIISATLECLRAAHAALRFEYFTVIRLLHSSEPTDYKFNPGVHSLAYAYSVSMPDNIQILPITSKESLLKWENHRNIFASLSREHFDITTFHFDNRVVARAKSNKYKKIFWGRPPKGVIFKNKHPHFVG